MSSEFCTYVVHVYMYTCTTCPTVILRGAHSKLITSPLTLICSNLLYMIQLLIVICLDLAPKSLWFCQYLDCNFDVISYLPLYQHVYMCISDRHYQVCIRYVSGVLHGDATLLHLIFLCCKYLHLLLSSLCVYCTNKYACM